MPTTLIERFEDWRADICVEAAQRLVSNVALAGRVSQNGYKYTESALRDAVALYDRKPVFLDHAASRARPHERSTRDLVGSITNVRYENQRVRADIRVLDTESGRTFLALAESDTPGVGMSHVVIADRGDDDNIHRIHDVVSVDAVIGPATTTTFRESTEPDDQVVAEDNTGSAREIHELREALASLNEQRATLESRLVSLEATVQECRETISVHRLLITEQVPGPQITSELVDRLRHAESDERRREIIHEQCPLGVRTNPSRPISSQRRGPATADIDQQFVAAIRGAPPQRQRSAA